MTHSIPTRRSCDLSGVATTGVGPAASVPALTPSPCSGQARARSAAVEARAYGGRHPSRSPSFDRLGVGECFRAGRSEEHTSELQSLLRISYDVFCLKKKTKYTHPARIMTSR